MNDADSMGGKNSSMWSAGSTDLFSNREIALLIELVEALPVLYAADKKLFKSIIPREKAWKIISEKLNRTGGSYTGIGYVATDVSFFFGFLLYFVVN